MGAGDIDNIAPMNVFDSITTIHSLYDGKVPWRKYKALILACSPEGAFNAAY